jgi:hypothetical protein
MGKGTKIMITRIALQASILLALCASAAWAGAPQESAQESQPEEMIVPEGTVIPIVLTTILNTRNSQVGDTIYADTTYPIWIQQRLVIPRGSNVRGTVTEVVRPGKIKGKGRLAVRFDDILLPNGVKHEFIATFRGIHSAGDESLDRKSESVSAGATKTDDIGTVVGTTEEGTIIGALVGHGTGAAIGAGAGAAAGIATLLFTRGRDLVISPGTTFDLELKKSMKFAFNELDFTNAQLNYVQPRAQPRPAQSNPRTPAWGGRRLGPFPGIGIPGPWF